eukprot:jgi/Astpho2/4513/fgenesh1_pm.00067_%23_24_t
MLKRDQEATQQLQYKVIVLGDGAVGKTSLCKRFTEDSFARSYKQTIGVDFFLKLIQLPGDRSVALQLWDIGGQTIASKMLASYIYGAQAVILVYDITNLQSFQDLEDWMALVQKVYTPDAMPQVALIGNKADLTHMRAVHLSKHNEFAEAHSMYSYFVSAKTGDNVAASFFRVAADLAGIVLTKPEIEVASKPITAQIIQHPQDAVAQATSTQGKARVKPHACMVM